DLNLPFKIDNSFFQIRNFVIGHGRDLDVARSDQFAVVVQLASRRFKFVPAFEELLDARMFAHDLAGALAIIKEMWVGNVAFRSDLNLPFKIDNSFFQIRNFVIGHGRDLDVARSDQFAVVVQLASRRFKFVPAFEELLDARMFAHDLAGALAIIKEMWVGNVAFEFCETFAFAFDEQINIHKNEGAAGPAAQQGAWHKRLDSNLCFLLGPRRFGAAVTAGELFHASGGIDEFLFTREKWMTGGTNTDLNITARRARVIHHPARADDVSLVILWMNACF